MPKGNVLIVEDDEPVRNLIATILDASGFCAIAAEDGLEALHVLRTVRRQSPEIPCLVLLDLALPRLSGREFRRAQLADPNVAQVPVAVISGAADLEARAEGLGAVATISKPIDVDRLMDVVQRHCSATPSLPPDAAIAAWSRDGH